MIVGESVHNPHFNYGEFAIIKSQAAVTCAREAGLLNVALFGQTAREWRNANPGKDGNLRDFVAGEEPPPRPCSTPAVIEPVAGFMLRVAQADLSRCSH